MKRLLPILLAALAALVLAACGGDEEGGTGSTADAATGTTSEPATDSGAAAKPGAVAISADPDGGLSYEQTEVSAEAGSVEIDFDNPSDVVHDVTIEQDGSDVGATERVTAAGTSTKLDLEPGEYTFYCSITGHRGAGMEGTLVVE